MIPPSQLSHYTGVKSSLQLLFIFNVLFPVAQKAVSNSFNTTKNCKAWDFSFSLYSSRAGQTEVPEMLCLTPRVDWRAQRTSCIQTQRQHDGQRTSKQLVDAAAAVIHLRDQSETKITAAVCDQMSSSAHLLGTTNLSNHHRKPQEVQQRCNNFLISQLADNLLKVMLNTSSFSNMRVCCFSLFYVIGNYLNKCNDC